MFLFADKTGPHRNVARRVTPRVCLKPLAYLPPEPEDQSTDEYDTIVIVTNERPRH
jgi:hypothetical protein